MLIDDVVDFCNGEYMGRKCSGCGRDRLCGQDCSRCLDDLHFHRNQIRRDYSCERLLNYYVCRYSHKYCSEMVYALQQVDLRAYPCFNILSLGCGGAPDLMAFDYLNLPQPIQYRGMDIDGSWEKIHAFIQEKYPDGNVKLFRQLDVHSFFQQFTLESCNVICIAYLISFFYSAIGANGVREWFRKLAQRMACHTRADSPLLIIINDVDSCNTGRDCFEFLCQELENAGLEVKTVHKMRFKDHNYYPDSVKHPSRANLFSIPEAFKQRYKAAITCESAQLILEVV